MRSLNERRRADWARGCDGTSILGTTGTSIFGDGGGAGSGGLNFDQPGGIICWPNTALENNVKMTTPITIENCLIPAMS